MPELKGFAPPYTVTGRSALIPDPPWFYSGDLLTVEYRTERGAVRALLPDDVDLAEEDPGAVAFIWADWQSCSTGGAELSTRRGRSTRRPSPSCAAATRAPRTRGACSSG